MAQHSLRKACLAVCLMFSLSVKAQDTIKTDAELNAEVLQAESLYKRAQPLAALPLFEDLHRQRPQNSAYTERLAMAYVAKGSATAVPAESVAARNHARQLFLDAQKEGDRSDLLQVMLEKLGPPETVPTQIEPALASGPRAAGGPFAQAEIAFSNGNLKAAIALYGQAWEQNPQFYPAPLYAGDAEYKLGNYEEAGAWFARAIAIDTNLETAHRYWADCLMKAGKPVEARKQYVEAFIADPYSKAPRLSLRAWANAEHMRYVAPAISLPAAPVTDKNGHINITIASSEKDDPLSAVWLMYSMNAAIWHGDKFKKEFPNEKVYRHSVAEEMDSIHNLLAGVQEQKIPDSKLTPTLRSLQMLDKDGMLECWILLDNPDNGTAQDYLAFRTTHYELLRAYIEKYDLHPV